MLSDTSHDSAHHSPTAEAVIGRVTGALFFVGFGSAWVFFGLKGLRLATPPSLEILALAAVAILTVCAWLQRRARSLPSGFTPPEAEERMKRMFTAVNIIQWVSVVTAVAILNVLHRPDYIAPAVAVIVGLHLLPLAQSFHYRQHYVTGALLVLWALTCMAVVQGERLSGICSLGTGVVLFVSAISTVLRCLVQVRGVHAPLPVAVTTA